MKVIYGGRQTGRTTSLIELCAEAEARGEVSYIICGTRDQAYKIAQRAKEMGLNIGFPITIDEFLNHQYAGQNIRNFYLDNAEWLLQCLTPVPIRAITIERKDDNSHS